MIAAKLTIGALGVLVLTACGSTEASRIDPAEPASEASPSAVEASASMSDVSPVVGYWELDMASTISEYEALLADRPEGDSKDAATAEWEMNKLLFTGVQQHYNINRDGTVVVQTAKAEDDSFDFEASSGSWEVLASGELRLHSPTRAFTCTLDGDKLSLKRVDQDLAPQWILLRLPAQK